MKVRLTCVTFGSLALGHPARRNSKLYFASKVSIIPLSPNCLSASTPAWLVHSLSLFISTAHGQGSNSFHDLLTRLLIEQLNVVDDDVSHEVEVAFIAHRRTGPRDAYCLVEVVSSVKETDRLAEVTRGLSPCIELSATAKVSV